MMDAIVKAAREALACAMHATATTYINVDDTPQEHVGRAIDYAHHCPACALSVANTVLVAARDGDAWVRAVPTELLAGVQNLLAGLFAAKVEADAVKAATDNELQRRNREER